MYLNSTMASKRPHSDTIYSAGYHGACGLTFNCRSLKERNIRMRLHMMKCDLCRGSPINKASFRVQGPGVVPGAAPAPAGEVLRLTEAKGLKVTSTRISMA